MNAHIQCDMAALKLRHSSTQESPRNSPRRNTSSRLASPNRGSHGPRTYGSNSVNSKGSGATPSSSFSPARDKNKGGRTRTTSENEDRLGASSESELVESMRKRMNRLEQTLADTTYQLSSLVDTNPNNGCGYTSVTFGKDEPLGLVLVLDKQKRVIVGDLKSTPSGQPMAAKACGLINIGDIVVSVNERNLCRHDTLDAVAHDFKNVERPVRILFRAMRE